LSATVAIIGAGPLGRWLALSAARAGFRVLLEDVMPANLHHAQEYIRGQLGPDPASASRIAERLDSGSYKCQGTTSVVPQMRQNEDGALAPAGNPPVTFVSTIEDAVREADLAIDCVPDELESKLEILWLLDRMAPPRTVFATPTTRLSIADLAGCTYREGKCVAIAAEARDLTCNSGAEILLRTTAQTTPETVALVENFWRRLGFKPTFQQEAVVSENSGQ
jgi:3-hydroxybutyryl-CoA dehydrogenase